MLACSSANSLRGQAIYTCRSDDVSHGVTWSRFETFSMPELSKLNIGSFLVWVKELVFSRNALLPLYVFEPI